MKKYFVLLFLLLNILSIFAQKNVKTVSQTWLTYVNNTRLNGKWGLTMDAQVRTRDAFVNGFSLLAIRGGVSYFLSEATSVTAGYAYFHYLPGDNHKNISRPEHRPWQQLQWNHPFTKGRLQQRLRLEERFRRKILNESKLAPGYNFNYRVRYQASLVAPVGKKPLAPHSFAFVLMDEVMLNFGSEIVYNTFDQNRLAAGFNYYVNKHGNIQMVYMNIFQQGATGKEYRNIHMARLSYNHNLDRREKHKIKS